MALEERDESGRRYLFDLVTTRCQHHSAMVYWVSIVYIRKLHELMRVWDLEILQHGLDSGRPAYNQLAWTEERLEHLLE